MIIAIWNGRGLGNGPAVNGLLDLRKREDPDVLFVSETKMEQDKLEWFRWKLEMPHMMVKNCEGRSGGLVLFWKREVNLKVIGFMSRYHIDTEITEPDGFVWRFTGIYGDPRTDGKENTWRLMRTLRHQNNKPWLCGGDFNEILHPWEKEGGVPRPQACMDRFKETLELCELDDLRFVGDAFTWRNNNHDANKYIRERLDRAVATQSWRDRFPGYKVVNGDPRHSDHRPIIINTHGVEKARRSPARGMVPRFEAKWLAEEEYATIVENAWDMEVYGHQKGVMGAVKGILGELVDWNRNKLGDLEKRISKIKKELEVWRKKGIGPEQVRREEILRFKLSRLEEQKELYWKQRAHVQWMKNGDRNTKYFHSAASERRKINRIKKLRREDGSVVEDEGAMKDVVTNYFVNLFSSNAGTRVDELLDHIDPRVTPAMNELLCKEFNAQEVKEALDSIGDLKAPGIDGMPSIFYKKSWELVGEKVTAEVLNVLNGGPMPEAQRDGMIHVLCSYQRRRTQNV
jgi:exonuclease III